MSALPDTPLDSAPVGLPDERLAARVAHDATAFTELHERYAQALFRYTRSLLRDPHDAADAAQDAWTRAFASLRHSPVRVLSFRSWLFGVARNACIDRMREGRRCAPADIDERALGASPAPDDVLELRARAREALSDLAGLSERQRAAVVLRDLNGLEGEELARALHTDARRASWLVTDARRSLWEVRSGRGLSCETARDQLDTARVRTRAVRAHLAGCPECDGYARRRVASRLHLHGFALFVLALPARLRAGFSGGLESAKPLGAIAAATLVAAVPAVQVLAPGRPGVGSTHPAPAAPAAARAAAAPVMPLPRARVRRRAVRERAATRIALTAPGSIRGVRSVAPQAPRWRAAAPAAATVPSRPAAGTLPAAIRLPGAATAPVRGAVQSVAGALSAVAPAAAPAVRAATHALADL